MNIEYLSTSDGVCLPMDHFKDCLVLLFFTNCKSRVCMNVLKVLKAVRLETIYSNVVFAHVSMDATLGDWDLCFKNENWLSVPFYPIQSRRFLFKHFKVDRLPFMVACSGRNHLIVPNHVMEDLKVNDVKPFISELEYYINLFHIDEYVLV